MFIRLIRYGLTVAFCAGLAFLAIDATVPQARPATAGASAFSGCIIMGVAR
jgi:hypothetical protein